MHVPLLERLGSLNAGNSSNGLANGSGFERTSHLQDRDGRFVGCKLELIL